MRVSGRLRAHQPDQQVVEADEAGEGALTVPYDGEGGTAAAKPW
ncbi:hypothetical protein [Streptomyces sp. NPDC088757]